MFQKVAHRLYFASLYPVWQSFVKAANSPEEAQSLILKTIIERNTNTRFGLSNGFAQIHSITDFQDRIPISNWDNYESVSQELANGYKNILTAENVIAFERTSGTTHAVKLIPYTNNFLLEVNKAIGPWMYDLYKNNKNLFGKPTYWAISPAAKLCATTPAGIPIGFNSDEDYLTIISKIIFKKLNAVPSSISKIQDINEWRFETSRYLVGNENLGLISVWHPTYLILIMRFVFDNLEEILKSIQSRRANKIRREIEKHSTVNGSILWPNLRLISCWGDGNAHIWLKEIETIFPGVYIQRKGLLATEGIVSIPIQEAGGSVVAANSHFLEFFDIKAQGNKPALVDELIEGEIYSPLLTTSGGLYRYKLNDRVKCVGYWKKLPIIEFIGRTNYESDVCGEKLSCEFVENALATANKRTPISFEFLLISTIKTSTVGYGLFIDTDLSGNSIAKFCDALEDELIKSFHYAYCRKLGQLEKVTYVRIKNGLEQWQKIKEKNGARVGELKPLILDTSTNWVEEFIPS